MINPGALSCRGSQCGKTITAVDFMCQGGETTSCACANNSKYLQHQKKIIKSATSPVLQGGFQCHKKQIAHIDVNDLKLMSLVYEI